MAGAANPGARLVAPAHPFDEAGLASFLRERVAPFAGSHEVEQFQGGQSNPTYRVTAGERRYVLRPTLPTIVTTFSLGLIGVWTGAPILETVFNWPGLGRALYQAIGFFDTPVIVGETVIFAYLLGITVFLLDIIYALVDPRVKVGGEGSRT